MLVDNYYNALLKFYCGNNVSTNGLTFVNSNGSSSGIDGWERLNWTSALTYIYFGSNNTRPTRQDYYLKGTKIEGLIEQNTKYQYEILEDGVKITRIMNIYNSNDEPVVIGEMVWYGLLSSGYVSSSWGIYDRSTFDVPITILPGESEQINYSIYFKYGR